jgi:arsenite methyltransferase
MENIKEFVKEKYSQIAAKSDLNENSGCCGTSSCCGTTPDYTVFSESYENQTGYHAGADLGLGCGIPTEFAGLKAGDHVLDLGSGAGNDCFVARAIVGETGKVTGLDFSEDMISKAQRNTTTLGYKNVDFVLGDIEEMPFENDRFDVILSNCVLNLVPDKSKAFSEIFRVLKHGGHFCVSDIVVKGQLSEKVLADAEMYAGCVSGALKMEDYVQVIKETGFDDLQIHKQKKIEIPDDILKKHLLEGETTNQLNENAGLFSITVSASKF